MTTNRTANGARAPGRRILGAPPPALRRIGVVLHPTREVHEQLAEIGRWARREGVSVVAAARADRRPLPPGIDPVPEASFARAGGILLAFGGDRTMLHALAAGAVHRVPVLGVKLGRVSFLADVEAADLGVALDALSRRRFAIEERTMLAVRNGDASGPRARRLQWRSRPRATCAAADRAPPDRPFRPQVPADRARATAISAARSARLTADARDQRAARYRLAPSRPRPSSTKVRGAVVPAPPRVLRRSRN